MTLNYRTHIGYTSSEDLENVELSWRNYTQEFCFESRDVTELAAGDDWVIKSKMREQEGLQKMALADWISIEIAGNVPKMTREPAYR